MTPGLVSNGQPVSNVFVYDAAGHRVDDVRIFDQFGQPLQVSSDVVAMPPGPEGQQPVTWPPDERALSVFPLRLVPGADPWAQQDGPWAPPAQMAPLAGSAVPSATPTGTTSPSEPERDAVTAESGAQVAARATHLSTRPAQGVRTTVATAPVAQSAEAGDLKSPPVRVRLPSGARPANEGRREP